MNLGKKRALAARTLKVGKERIIFVNTRLDEIKEAITKQDIRDLKASGAIIIKGIKGRKKITKMKNKRSPGNIRKNVNKRKKNYMILTRKLRKHIKEIKKQGRISQGDFVDIRKKIKNKQFRSLAHIKENLGEYK